MTDSAAAIASRADALVADHVHLLKRLVELRHERELTVDEVADRMGVSPDTAAEMEHYNANPSLARVRRYALAVGAVFTTDVRDGVDADTRPAPHQGRNIERYVPVRFADFVSTKPYDDWQGQEELIGLVSRGRKR
jgi:transcriptional regulator with XRE-family HTH domain